MKLLSFLSLLLLSWSVVAQEREPGDLSERDWLADHVLPPVMKKWQGKPWQAKAEAFCKEAQRVFWEQDRPGMDKLGPQAKALLQETEGEPLIWWSWCYALRVASPHEPTNLKLDNSAASHLPKLPAALVCEYWINYMSAWITKEPTDALLALLKTKQEHSFPAGEEKLEVAKGIQLLSKMNRVAPAFWEKAAQQIEATQMDDGVRHGLLCELHMKWAWAERGSGYAYTVTEAGWKGFAEHLEKSRSHMEKSLETLPSSHVAACGITLDKGQGLGGAAIRTSLKRALDLNPNNSKAMSDAIDAMLPKWGGSVEDLLEQADLWIEEGRYDTVAPAMALSAILQAVREMGGSTRERCKTPEFRERIQRITQGYRSAPDLPLPHHQQVMAYVGVANWFMEDWEALFEARIRAKCPTRESEMGLVRNLLRTPATILQEYDIRRTAPTLTPLVYPWLEGHDEEARLALNNIDPTTLPPAYKLVLQQAKEDLSFESTLLSGAWHTFTYSRASPALLLWSNYGGHHTHDEAPHTRIFTAMQDRWSTTNYIRHLTEEDVELRGTVTLDVDWETAAQPIEWYPFTGAAASPLQPRTERILVTVIQGVKAMVQLTSSEPDGQEPVADAAWNPGANTFLMRVQDGKLSFELNGEELIKDQPLKAKQSSARGHFGFSARNLPEKGRLLLSDLAVRSLNGGLLKP